MLSLTQSQNFGSPGAAFLWLPLNGQKGAVPAVLGLAGGMECHILSGVGRAGHRGRRVSELCAGRGGGAWVGRKGGTGGAAVGCERLVKEKDILARDGDSRSDRRLVICRGSI